MYLLQASSTCYTVVMIDRPKESEPGTKSATNPWRDRLNKELATQGKKPTGTPNGAFHGNITNRFQKNKIGNTSRKTKKGLRAK